MTAFGPDPWQRAQSALAQRHLPEAERLLEAVLATEPGHVQARVLLAGICLARGRLRAACAHLTQATRALPDDATTVCRVAQALLRVGESTALRECLSHPAVARCHDGAMLATFAHLQQSLGEHEQALSLMDRARALGHDNADFRYFRSVQLQFNGRLDEAERELESCLRLGPTYGRAWLTLARLRKQTPQRNHLDDIGRQLARVAADSQDHSALEFARYKELEDLGAYEDAWKALEHANAIMHRQLRHDPRKEQALHAALIAACDAAFLQSAPAPAPASAADGPTPIFVLGLPRSGTTVVDRILGNHSQVVSAGELNDFAHQLRWQADAPGQPLVDEVILERLRGLDFAEIGRRYLAQTAWRAQGRGYFVDKLPANFLVAGLIAKALPQAVILHLARDPMDVCFSNYRALFGNSYAYSYDLQALAAHYASYRRLMAHWRQALPGRILDVDYQALVTDPEAEAGRILDFCGLAREAHCTDLVRNTAPVSTLSSAQVREGIHARGLAEWKRYERQLQPLREALEPFAAPEAR
ncbi:tetratricopeptide repeat-containing sulfotransferase family protein [Luteimonas aquatica]|uniref:tetratricopeptide repeat-containing sulfotransferase family protein n=1 Tax=Luteimonas aquatica TaxID=450364 RepID=UPI001F5ABF2A|nr:sulfotransferase [Luteimonas aquatica]